MTARRVHTHVHAGADHHRAAHGAGLAAHGVRISKGQTPGLTQLLHHDAIALNLIQFELDCGGSFRRLRIGCLDRPEDFALGAQQHHAPAAFHALGELGGVSLLVRRRVGMPRK